MRNSCFFLFLFIYLSSCQPDPVNPPNTGPLRDTTLFNVPYGSDPAQKLDLGLPANRTNNSALVLVIHGGGWATGDKAELNWLLNGLKARGFAVANINGCLLQATANPLGHDQTTVVVGGVGGECQ